MSKKNRRPSGGNAPQRGCTEAGQGVSASQVPATEPECEGGAMPLGIPIPIEEFKAQQQDSKRRKHRNHGVAQEDTGGAVDT
jgi:hypothetical protein